MHSKDYLLEIGLEELPAKSMLMLMQSLESFMESALTEARLGFKSLEVTAAPRRLVLIVRGLAEAQESSDVEKRGPAKVAAFDANGEPTKALLGFARSCNAELADLEVLETDKGAWMMYRASVDGAAVASVMPGLIENAIQQLPIAKRMRWGSSRYEFIRPVHWLVSLYGNEMLPVELFGQTSGRQTKGHRSHSPDYFEITSIADYKTQLEAAHVLVDFDERRTRIRTQITELVDSQFPGAETTGIHAVVDEALLNEVCALTDWPVAMLGRFDERFLEVPSECLISTMKENQKYFHVVGGDGAMLAAFVFIANLDSAQPERVIEGNERVVRPRLSDAAFFYDTDRKLTLESRLPRLETILFQKALGTVADKSSRVARLAAFLAPKTACSADDARRAGQLCKTDLVTNMVSEFPELQGVMGRYYAVHDGETEAVAAAIEQHYWPRFAGDAVPEGPVAAAVAIADRIDTLIGIFGIGQPPSGTRDPFALRRAALGLLRICVEHKLSLDLRTVCTEAAKGFAEGISIEAELLDTVVDYILDRFKNLYEEMGVSSAAFAAVRRRPVTDPWEFHQRILAVDEFRLLPQADALISANRRVSNILEKSAGAGADTESGPGVAAIDASLFEEPEERALYEKLAALEGEVAPLVAAGNFTEALTRLADLKDPTDAFFDKVMVMSDHPQQRTNRISLLLRLRQLFLQIADIAALAG